MLRTDRQTDIRTDRGNPLKHPGYNDKMNEIYSCQTIKDGLIEQFKCT